jgi:hypothetical protein
MGAAAIYFPTVLYHASGFLAQDFLPNFANFVILEYPVLPAL